MAEPSERVDVCVVGSGIAGICAALSAAEALGPRGRVLLASLGPTFSGSSFRATTWGLGLVGPQDENDQQDLVDTILQNGAGVADPILVQSLVAGIPSALGWLEARGVSLRRPAQEAAEQVEYIPCFDHKHRLWRGLERKPLMAAMGLRLKEQGVICQGGWELLDWQNVGTSYHPGFLLTFYQQDIHAFRQVQARALVLCGGGAAGMYSQTLASLQGSGTLQALAVDRGAKTVNLEFIQFMPGLVEPVRNIVFNEKIWRYLRLPSSVIDRFGGEDATRDLLEMRSGYGPFTCARKSFLVDLVLHEAGPQGLEVVPMFPRELPEFVQTFQEWLDGVAPRASRHMRLAHYAQASNGGLCIDSQAATDAPGVFAAGEGTGGMHGADRLGGLSSANALVFGLKAGRSAAAYAQLGGEDAGRRFCVVGFPDWTREGLPEYHYACGGSPGDSRALTELPKGPCTCEGLPGNRVDGLGTVMDKCCGVVRTQDGLLKGLEWIDVMGQAAGRGPTGDYIEPCQAALARRGYLQRKTARLIMSAALAREESKGSHYRCK